MRQGRKSAAQTKAPLKDRIKGSNVNKKGSASSESKASSILLSNEITSTLSQKAKDFNEKNKGENVSLATLKAVFRRGAGAFSTSHRPNMTRNGWAFARVNKFLEKKGGKAVKKAYIQDDDLLSKGGKLFNDKELLAKWKKGESIGFTGEAHLKAKGLIPRADGTKRKSEKYMENGGELGQEVVCVNCGWHWNTIDSDEYDKYVCHKCGFDNSLFYSNDIMAKGGLITNDNIEVEGLSNYTKNLKSGKFYHLFGKRKLSNDSNEYWWISFSRKDGVNKLGNVRYRNENDEEKNISLNELPKSLIEIYNNPDIKFDKGGLVATNGKSSNLTPEQYKLVRTPQFKAWFGDWENDPQTASKIVDENGEPLVVYHGTATDFNIFKIGSSRGIFFSNKKSSAELFSEGQYKRSGDKPQIKECFLYSLNPFYKNLTKDSILEKEYYENYFNERPFISEKSKKLILKKDNFKNEIVFFGIVDEDKKNKLIEFGYDSIIIDADNNSKSYIVFEPNQIKLADGTNTTFDMNNPDIRYEKGGKLKPAKSLLQIAKEKKVTITYAFDQLKKGMKAESEHSDDKKIQKTIALQHLDENIDYYKKLAKMESTFKYGGEINADNPKIKDEMIHKSGKVGGLLVGKRHSEGGIKAINKSNNSPLEMEGGEVVITRNAVSDDTKREFEGEMLTNRQILSKINEGGGGVSFADGGDIPEHIMVSGKTYKYGGKTLKDNEIVDYCGCKHKMAQGGDLKHFGVKHHDLKPSEAFKKMFSHKYKRGGRIESIVLIDKSVPSYNDFKNNNKNINLHTNKTEYKKYLRNNYKVDFDHLPNSIKMALLLGNQKLVDNYINA